MHPHRLWLLGILLVTNTVFEANSHCPCVSQEACSQTAGLVSHTACEDTTFVSCCVDTSSDSEPLQMIKADLEKEQKFLEAIDILMEKIQNVGEQRGKHRDDKSLEGTLKNSFNCDDKHCTTSGSSNKENFKGQLESLGKKVTNKFNVTQKIHTEGQGENELLIVYAENSNETYKENDPVIVYPSKTGREEYLQSDNATAMTQNLAEKENKRENITIEKTNLLAVKNQQSNLHKLFPKRHSPLKLSTSNTDSEDLGEAESEIEEVKTNAPTDSQSGQTVNQKSLRSHRRHFLKKPIAKDEGLQNGSSSEQNQGLGEQGPLISQQNNTANPENQEPTSVMIDDINLKAINDMMKTNFTGRSSFQRKQRPLKQSSTRLHFTSNTTLNLPTGKTHQETKDLSQSTTPSQTNSLPALLDETNNKTFERVEQNINNSTTESKSRYISRRRNKLRNQNMSLLPKSSTAVSMSQEQVFDTLKENKPQDTSKRRTSYRRLQAKTPIETTNIGLAEQINSQADSSLGKRRTRFRPRSKSEYMTPTKANNNTEVIEPTTQDTESTTYMTNTAELTNQSTDRAATGASGEEPIAKDKTSEGDLEGSGSDIQSQRVQGRFSPPRRMEKGFQPMFGQSELNVVGHLPTGFQDKARGFSDGELEFELPKANGQSEFTESQFQQFEKETEETLRLLPPVFPIPQPLISPIVSSRPSSLSSDTYSEDDLLPPVQTPQPLSITLAKIRSNKAEKLMIDQHRDITQLNQEFNTLKNRYDMLLNRYADTLKTYNDKYKNLFVSGEEGKK